jgi:hypothetical protein
MSNFAKPLTAALQANHLKSLGFQKRYETFSRSHPAFSEHFQIQSSLLNRSGEPWKYDLILGIGFHAIPAKQKGQLAGTHASKRLLTVETSLLENDSKELTAEAAKLAEIILEQSAYLQRRHEILRSSYDRNQLKEGFPTDPEIDSTD